MKHLQLILKSFYLYQITNHLNLKNKHQKYKKKKSIIYLNIQMKIQMMKTLNYLVHLNKNNLNLKVLFLLKGEEEDHLEVKIKHQKKDSKIKCRRF